MLCQTDKGKRTRMRVLTRPTATNLEAISKVGRRCSCDVRRQDVGQTRRQMPG